MSISVNDYTTICAKYKVFAVLTSLYNNKNEFSAKMCLKPLQNQVNKFLKLKIESKAKITTVTIQTSMASYIRPTLTKMGVRR